MDLEQIQKEHGTPEKLEYYAFMWSLARMALAAVALLLGGVPPLLWLLKGTSSGIWSILSIAWLISGIATLYLLYVWNKNGQRVFGGKDTKDLVAFGVMSVSGINLGLAGLNMGNIGLSIFSADVFLFIGAAIYIVTIWHLYTRWTQNGKQLFGGSQKAATEPPTSASGDANTPAQN